MCQNSASLHCVCSGDSASWLGKWEDSGGSVLGVGLEENFSWRPESSGMAATFKLNTGSPLCCAGVGTGPEHLTALSAGCQKHTELLRAVSDCAQSLAQSPAQLNQVLHWPRAYTSWNRSFVIAHQCRQPSEKGVPCSHSLSCARQWGRSGSWSGWILGIFCPRFSGPAPLPDSQWGSVCCQCILHLAVVCICLTAASGFHLNLQTNHGVRWGRGRSPAPASNKEQQRCWWTLLQGLNPTGVSWCAGFCVLHQPWSQRSRRWALPACLLRGIYRPAPSGCWWTKITPCFYHPVLSWDVFGKTTVTLWQMAKKANAVFYITSMFPPLLSPALEAVFGDGVCWHWSWGDSRRLEQGAGHLAHISPHALRLTSRPSPTGIYAKDGAWKWTGASGGVSAFAEPLNSPPQPACTDCCSSLSPFALKSQIGQQN